MSGHPFEGVSMHRIAQSHPRFLEALDIQKLHANISFERAKQHLGNKENDRQNNARQNFSRT